MLTGTSRHIGIAEMALEVWRKEAVTGWQGPLTEGVPLPGGLLFWFERGGVPYLVTGVCRFAIQSSIAVKVLDTEV